MATFEHVERNRDATLRNLYEHYVHDMSEWLGIDARDDGAFGFDTAPLWRDNYSVYFAKVDHSLAGFGVVGPAQRWLGHADVRDMKDLFVLRRFRRQGIASAFAVHLWNEFPGEWLIRVLVANKPALPFWRRAVRNYMQGHFEERNLHERGTDGVERDWVHLRFDTRLRNSPPVS
jgi:predicted acetyltransferase